MAETGLLPHINAGVMSLADIQALRKVLSLPQGLCLLCAMSNICR